MYHFFEAILNTKGGGALVGYFVRVINPSSQAVVPIYADNAGTPISTVSEVANMAKTDSDGNADLYVAPGTYHLDIYETDATTFKRRIQNVPMLDGGSNFIDTLNAIKAANTASGIVIYDGATFTWTAGDYTGQDDDTNIIESDSVALSEGAWIRQESNSVTYLQAGSGAFLRTAQDKMRDIIDAKDFGAVGDGETDDTEALNAAATRAKEVGGHLSLATGATYLLSGFLVLNDGTAGVFGNGATLKLQEDSTAGVLLRGKESGAASNVSGCVIRDLVIDMNDTDGFALYGQNCVACQFLNNRVYGAQNAQATLLIRSFTNGVTPARDNLIEGNAIDATGNGTIACIQIDSLVGMVSTDNKIIGNTVIGGQYGVGLGYAARTILNVLEATGQLRTVSLQNSCDGSLISLVNGNLFTDNCIHIVASDGVHVSNCRAVTSDEVFAQGEGAFNAYKGSTNCTFTNCETYIPSASGNGPEFHFYAGGSASGNRFIDCLARGIAYRSYFCIEAAYRDSSSPYAVISGVSAGRNKGGANPADATNDTVNAGFINCIVDGSSARPAFALTQITAGGNLRALTAPIVRGCQAIGTAYSHILYLYEENSGSLSDGIVDNLRNDAGIADSKFNLPRGTDHFASLGNNTQILLNFWLGTFTFGGDWGGDYTLTKDGNGIVCGEGLINGTTNLNSGQLVMTAPVGFRNGIQNASVFANNSGTVRALLMNGSGTIDGNFVNQTTIGSGTGYSFSFSYKAAG